jgi:hypothetical protein
MISKLKMSALPLNTEIKSCFTKTHDNVSFFNANCDYQVTAVVSEKCFINPLNAELNPICHLLALLRDQHIFQVSRIRINGFISSAYYPIQGNFHRKQHTATYSLGVVVSFEVILC